MLKSLMTVSGFTLLSRILGFVRDMLVGHYLGVGRVSDAWNAAFQFPNLFRRVFGEGAFNSAFVPMYSRIRAEEGDDSAFRFGNRVIVMLSLVLSVIFALCFFFIRPIIYAMNKGFEAETVDLAAGLAKITSGYMVFVCLVAAVSGILNSHKKFMAPAFSYAFLNMAFLVGLLTCVPRFGAPEEVLSWSLLAAGVIQLVVVLIPALKLGLKLKAHIPKFDAEMKKLGLLMLPGLMSAGVQQVNLLVGGWVASFQEGAKTMVYYADRINQLPLGLIGIAFGVVLLPDITRKVRSKDEAGALDSMQKGLTMAMLVAIPAMVGMTVLAQPIIFALFQGGEFEASDAILTGQALMAFALGCPAYIMVRVLQPSYFAREDTKTPMHYTFWSAGLNVVLCMAVFYTLKEKGLLHVGCAVATTIAGWVNVLLLMMGLRKKGFLTLTRDYWKRFAKMLIAAILMGGIVYTLAAALDRWIYIDSRIIRMGVIGAIGTVGVLVYFSFAHLTKAMTLKELKQGFRGA